MDYDAYLAKSTLSGEESLFWMFNGDVEIRSFRTITKRETSWVNDDLENRKKEFERDSDKVFEIAANLCG